MPGAPQADWYRESPPGTPGPPFPAQTCRPGLSLPARGSWTRWVPRTRWSRWTPFRRGTRGLLSIPGRSGARAGAETRPEPGPPGLLPPTETPATHRPPSGSRASEPLPPGSRSPNIPPFQRDPLQQSVGFRPEQVLAVGAVGGGKGRNEISRQFLQDLPPLLPGRPHDHSDHLRPGDALPGLEGGGRADVAAGNPLRGRYRHVVVRVEGSRPLLHVRRGVGHFTLLHGDAQTQQDHLGKLGPPDRIARVELPAVLVDVAAYHPVRRATQDGGAVGRATDVHELHAPGNPAWGLSGRGGRGRRDRGRSGRWDSRGG